MELINLKGLNLTTKEWRDIIKFIAQKRGIIAKQLLPTIKPNPKRKNDVILTTKTQQEITKTLQKVAKTKQKAAKPKITKNLTNKKLLKLEKRKNTQNLTYEKPLKLAKFENLKNNKTTNLVEN